MESIERPMLVQGSHKPIVTRLGSEEPNLICPNCNESVLIENYLASCFVGIGLKCFKCSHVTWTPSLAAGDVFPKTTITLGNKGAFLIGSTVTNEKDVVMTCDQELEKVHKPTASRDKEPFELTVENLDKLSLELDLLSGGGFQKHLESAERSIKHKNPYFRENPLAWAIQLLKHQLAKETISLDRSGLVAISMIQGYQDVLYRWRDHIHFPSMAKELCGYFYHSLIQLISASYLMDHGNNIALNLTSDEEGERSADLYLKLSGRDKLFIEVKAPESFEWTNEQVGNGKIKKTIEKCLSKSRGQLDEIKPGILIIGTSCLSPEFLPEIERTVKKVLKNKGRSYSGVAGIGVVGLESISSGFGAASKFSTSYKVFVSRNPYYFAENPIVTT
ncbi:hypothetical protein QUO16_004737 [Vibrio parahaemolyticus]|uniref:hypothetical protein n=1 Tax=Vibrio parahaemolyticus TaxID=670 RepID=UPI000A373547|nr:hypothetical protein [Vibrio parahaemolyticus]ELA9373403.1 hypothetical protein [Vibrio parahaemolyticus]OUJ32369.1 hypothetical protein BTR40_24460 [Vibrio parahaemolyticus]OUJ45677.1 hypothetical protein BTM22_25810 [Vibrio parahaemolyticus]HCM0916221.1 hypothetical protein [Vibrio parahaemolyticus]